MLLNHPDPAPWLRKFLIPIGRLSGDFWDPAIDPLTAGIKGSSDFDGQAKTLRHQIKPETLELEEP